MSGTQSVLGNGLKLVGEVVVPGASELLEGRIGSGLLHTVVAAGAGLLLSGTPVLAGLAILAVRANSYSRSVSGQGIVGAAIDQSKSFTTGHPG
jgi:hypothetical protein